jgi:hypothetical protein
MKNNQKIGNNILECFMNILRKNIYLSISTNLFGYLYTFYIEVVEY